MASAASADQESAPNVMRLCGSSESTCGYCQGKRSHLINKTKEDSSKSYGLLVDSLSAQDYETLMNHGWRRSGLHLYKPDNWNSCCPALSIRLEVQKFKISKSQKRVLRTMQRCLDNSTGGRPAHRKVGRVLSRAEMLVNNSGVLQHLQKLTHEVLSRQCDNQEINLSLCAFKFQTGKRREHGDNEAVAFTTACAAVAGRSKGRWSREDLSVDLAKDLSQVSSNKWPFSIRLASVNRHQESGHVLVTLQVPEEENATMQSDSILEEDMDDLSSRPPDIFGDWLRSMGETSLRPPYKLKVSCLPAQESALQPDVHRLYALYQHEIHGDPDPFASKEVKVNNGDDEEDDDWDTAGLEKAGQMLEREYGNKYTSLQMQRIQRSYLSFYRFLVESPLSSPDDQTMKRFGISTGTFHQQYRVGGQLIAVGVVDVLPSGLSSVYAFYDPLISKHLALGKFAILKEIEWTQQSGLPYYYLGYYIESCVKMKYKADYKPSELLCPTHYRWVDAEKAQQVLQRSSPVRHCCTFYEGPLDEAKNGSSARVETVGLDVGAASTVTLNNLNPHGQAVVRPLLEEFLAEVGTDVGQRCVIKLV